MADYLHNFKFINLNNPPKSQFLASQLRLNSLLKYSCMCCVKTNTVLRSTFIGNRYKSLNGNNSNKV